MPVNQGFFEIINHFLLKFCKPSVYAVCVSQNLEYHPLQPSATPFLVCCNHIHLTSRIFRDLYHPSKLPAVRAALRMSTFSFFFLLVLYRHKLKSILTSNQINQNASLQLSNLYKCIDIQFLRNKHMQFYSFSRRTIQHLARFSIV